MVFFSYERIINLFMYIFLDVQSLTTTTININNDVVDYENDHVRFWLEGSRKECRCDWFAYAMFINNIHLWNSSIVEYISCFWEGKKIIR